MSQGTRVYPVRLPDQLVEHVRETIARRNLWSIEEPWDLSKFIRVALEEKCKKMARSRRRARRGGPPVTNQQ